jgi:hypothetical protein
MTPQLKFYLGLDGIFKPGDKVVITHLPLTMIHFRNTETYAVVLYNSHQNHGYIDTKTERGYALWFPEIDSLVAWYPEGILKPYTEDPVRILSDHEKAALQLSEYKQKNS